MDTSRLLSREELARFEALLALCERARPADLAFGDLADLARRYRQATSMLARLRDRGEDPEAVRYLNALCVRAYSLLTVPGRSRAADTSFLERVRRALGRTWRAQLVAWALLAVGIYVGAALVERNPKATYALVPESLGYSAARMDRLLASPEERLAFLEPEAQPVSHNVLFGSSLFANNTRVGLFALAGGILAGIPTILLTVYNGTILGAFGAVFLRPPHHLEFLAWILPHGIPELTAIALCSAGGLLLGVPLVAPGRRGRRAAWGEAMEAALLLAAAAIPLLMAAALIESFVRESALGVTPRLAVAAGMALLVGGFLGASRREARRRPDARWIRELRGGTGGSPDSG